MDFTVKDLIIFVVIFVVMLVIIIYYIFYSGPPRNNNNKIMIIDNHKTSRKSGYNRKKYSDSKWYNDMEEIRRMLDQMLIHNKKDLKGLYELIKIRNNAMDWKMPYIPESEHITYNDLTKKKYLK